MLLNCVTFCALLLNIFTLTISQQTICCYWPCFIDTPMVTHQQEKMEIPPTTERQLKYIFYAPLLCPQGHHSINGVCRKIYGLANNEN